MSDATPDDPPTIDEPLTIHDAEALRPDVTFVVPASAYDSIAADEELARTFEAGPSPTMSPAATDLGPALRAIEGLGRDLHGKIDALAVAFEREIRAEATREKVVDRLHAELQDYKQDLLLNVMRPVFVDLIQLHDDIGKMAASVGEDDRGEGEPAPPRNVFDDVRQGIEDILYRQGVEPYLVEGDAFDARRQRAISTVPTDDASLGRKVAGRLRKGFAAGDRVIRPEVVSVFVYKAPMPTASAP